MDKLIENNKYLGSQKIQSRKALSTSNVMKYNELYNNRISNPNKKCIYKYNFRCRSKNAI